MEIDSIFRKKYNNNLNYKSPKLNILRKILIENNSSKSNSLDVNKGSRISLPNCLVKFTSTRK